MPSFFRYGTAGATHAELVTDEQLAAAGELMYRAYILPSVIAEVTRDRRHPVLSK
jgi:hypothetical protein